MTTYIRPSAVARDDADMIVGWNISPNTGYQLQLSATTAGAVVILLSVDGSTLIGSGVAAVGTAQPVTITPMPGQTVGMADASMGWHMLLTTDGTEGDRTITMDAMVDLSARTHPVYVDDDLALAVAAADINAGTHYTQDVVASCPLGFGVSVGDTASVPVDGVAVVGQVESITWTGMPDGASDSVVIRRHVAIAPDAFVEPVPLVPPAVTDDILTTTHLAGTSGNVLANDAGGLTIAAVNGLSANVGVAVDGSNGGTFTISTDGTWTFAPDGDFALLSGSETADTSVTYYASDGVSEAMATLTVTVSSAGVETDPYWQYVELYLPMTGANNGTSFTDVAKGRTVTRNAPLITQAGTGPQSETSYAYYTSGSDTTASQLSVPNHATLNLGNKDFCAEWFYRPTTLPASKNHPRFFDKRGSTNNYEIMLFYYSGVLYFYVSADGTSLTALINGTAWSPTLNQWYHMRVSRNGSDWRLWINGQKFWQGSWSETIFSGTAPFMLMGDNVNAHLGTWSMSHFRLTVGHSRETTDVIDVPTLPYPTI